MNSGTTPPVDPGLRKLHLLYRPPSPSPEIPQMLSGVTADMTSFAALKGVCTSQRKPPVSVRVGDTRHESWKKPPKMLIWPSRTLGASETYWFVSGSSAACPITAPTPPVSSAYISRASFSCADEPDRKLDVVNSPRAGSKS